MGKHKPVFIDACKKGHELGISMAVGTNAFVLTKNRLEELLPYLTYLRVNFSAGEEKICRDYGSKRVCF